MRKRMKKLEGMRIEMGAPEIYPSRESEIALLGWGSTYGAIKEAVDLMNQEGLSTRMLHFSDIYPFVSGHFIEKIRKDARVFAVEGNYTGQFADLFSFETGIPIYHKILKYEGRPFTPGEIVTRVKERL